MLVYKFCLYYLYSLIKNNKNKKYSNCTKGNAYVERFNRSLEEGFIDYREDELREDIEGFNRELMEYLIWYNTERVHSGIGGKLL